MRAKIIIGVVVAIVAVLGVAVFFFLRGPDLSAYERFREAAVIAMSAQKMLVVEAAGSPEAVGGKAIKLLFGTYFKLDGVSKGPGMPAPRARWPKGLNTPKEQWVGRYAMPVSDSLGALPKVDAEPGLSVKLDTWNYGEVVQILHVGPYDKETPTIERLQAFIKSKGLEIAGDHEEEYLRGPTMFGKGNPEKYYTLIRYNVRQAGKTH
ncbi:MAG: hypothetical protein HY897_12865 [Deltaproteobacteria bacterium]|nr:hypothetical protein [Deltaproteobacteria bacterium]